jgi:hypothetical protein
MECKKAKNIVIAPLHILENVADVSDTNQRKKNSSRLFFS